MKSTAALLAGLFFAAAANAQEAQTPLLLPTPEKVQALVTGSPGFPQAPDTRPVRLFAEAEDFKIEKPGWHVVPFRENYFASTFALTFLSRMASLGAPAQPATDAVATQRVLVPADGTFKLLARYEQPYNFSVEFTVEVEQNGKVVFSKLFGKLEDEKIWALNGHKRVAMERFWWGGTDNQVWQQADGIALAKGEATIRLIASKQLENGKPRVNAAARSVDILCLTNDDAGAAAQLKTRYLEFDGWLVQAGDLYLRVTNKGDAPVAPAITPNVYGHSPYNVHIRDWVGTTILKDGRIDAAAPYQIAGPRAAAVLPANLAPSLDAAPFLVPADPKKPDGPKKQVIPAERSLAPGQTSGWVPVGHMVDALHDCVWTLTTKTPLAVEFGLPDGKGGIRPLRTLDLPAGNTTLEVPANIAPNPALQHALKERWWLPELRTVPETLTWLADQVEKFPDKGPVAKRFLVYSIGGFGGTPSTPEGQRLMRALGDNTVVGQQGNKRGVRFRQTAIDQKSLEKLDLSDVRVVSYGDETHLPESALTNEELDAWLKKNNVAFDGKVEYTRRNTDPLYYYSVIAAVEKGAQPYIAATEYFKSKGVLAGANYSPHANYMVSEMHWVRPFKLNAMSLPWSEDYVWQIPEFSVQVVGYMVTAFRCGAKYHGQPIHMYIMPHSPGNTPRDFRLSAYAAVANGSRQLDYFCASPLSVGGTENYVATNDLPMWRAVHAVTHEVGKFEDYVLDGKVRQAKVALLLSSVDDVLTGAHNGSLAMHNAERKATYYALKHAQVPVDMVTEDDLVDGLCKGYDVIYVAQQHLHSKAVAALKKWVENGGTAVALCGGGFKNEFLRDNPAAGDLFGVSSQSLETDPDLLKYLLKANTPFLAKQDLPLYVPMDQVKMESGGASLPVIVWKQSLEPASGAKVLARFGDGKPAAVEKAHGKGRAILFGFLPGQAYIKSGVPLRPADRGAVDTANSHFLPTSMDRATRAAFVDSLLPASLKRPVECSAELIESSCIDTPAADGKPARLAVPLMNFSGTPVKELTVKIADLPAAKRVVSVERGELKPTFSGGVMTVTLPLDVADMLLIDR